MAALLGFGSILGFVVLLVLLIIALIRKRSKKVFLIGMVACLILFFVALELTPTKQDDPLGQNSISENTETPPEEPAATCEHDWREVSREEPTTEQQGVSHQECALCGETRDQFIGKLEKVVTFDEIYQAYKENELRADDAYKGNRYTITAKINGMATGGLLNLTGGATLTMEKQVGNTIVFFYAEFEKDQEEALKKVNVGDTITYEGECVSAGTWTDCELK